MGNKPREPKRKRNLTPAEVPPLLQRMPGMAYRLDPTAVPHLAVWIIALSKKYHTALSNDRSPSDERQRVAWLRHRDYLRHAIVAIDDIVLRLFERLPAGDIDDASHIVAATFKKMSNGLTYSVEFGLVTPAGEEGV